MIEVLVPRVLLPACLLLVGAGCTRPQGDRAGGPSQRTEAWAVRVAGNEPFWNLEASPSAVVLQRFGITDTVRFDGATRRLEEETWTIQPLGPDSGRLTLRLRPGPCLDSMSGAPFEFSAHLHMDSLTLAGCAEPLAPGGEDAEIVSATAITLTTGGVCRRLALGPRCALGTRPPELRRISYVCGDSAGGMRGIAGPAGPPPEWSFSNRDDRDLPPELLMVSTHRGEGSLVAEKVDTVVVLSVVLDDGRECLRSGEGATLSFDGSRLNYSCQDAEDGALTALMGPFHWGERWSVRRASLSRSDEGWRLTGSSSVYVREARVGPASDGRALKTF